MSQVTPVSIPEVDSVLKSYVGKPINGLLGIAAMAVNREGQIAYSGAFGRRSLDPTNTKAMTLDTVCWIASQTKLVAGITAMLCVERGQIGLDDDVGRICPELAEPNILEGFDENGVNRQTCEDYVKLLAAILQDGGGILKKETVDLIAMPQLGRDLVSGLNASRSAVHLPGVVLNFGLTVEIHPNGIPGSHAPGSFCWGGKPNLSWWVDRKTGLAGTVFQQVLPSDDPVSDQFYNEFKNALYKHFTG